MRAPMEDVLSMEVGTRAYSNQSSIS